MKIFISLDGHSIRELRKVDEVQVNHSKNLVITYLNFQTKPFSECFAPEAWDTIIINKKAE